MQPHPTHLESPLSTTWQSGLSDEVVVVAILSWPTRPWDTESYCFHLHPCHSYCFLLSSFWLIPSHLCKTASPGPRRRKKTIDGLGCGAGRSTRLCCLHRSVYQYYCPPQPPPPPPASLPSSPPFPPRPVCPDSSLSLRRCKPPLLLIPCIRISLQSTASLLPSFHLGLLAPRLLGFAASSSLPSSWFSCWHGCPPRAQLLLD